MFYFVPAQKGRHEDEVEDEEGPEYGEIEILKEGEQGAQEVRVDQALPEDELLDLSLETLEFIVVPHGQDVVHFFEVLVLRVHQGRQVEHQFVQVEEAQQIGHHGITLSQVHSETKQ